MKNISTGLLMLIALIWPPVSAANESWNDIGGYIFATDVSGDIGFRNINVKADIDFKDILKSLDFAAMFYGEHRRNRFSLIYDIFYVKLSSSNNLGSNNIVTIGIDTEVKNAILEGYLGYRVLDKEFAGQRKLGLDVLAGARYNSIDTTLGIQASGLGLTLGTQRRQDVDWVDPVVAMRLQFQPNNCWGTSLWFDYGGFGVGSKNTYQWYATGYYWLTQSIRAFAGWRHYDFDYSKGSGPSRFALDVNYDGPLLGLIFRF